MNNQFFRYYLRHLKHDIPAGIVVFLIALPLSLGIALASGVSLFAGLIAGTVGGLVLSWLSGSQLSVSGPSMGLTAVIVSSIAALGSFPAFLLATVVAGVIQVILGFLRVGAVAAYVPSATIKGMLSAIGLLLVARQLPLAVGYVSAADLAHQFPGQSRPTFEWMHVFKDMSLTAVMISAGALLILAFWDTRRVRQTPWLRVLPAPLLVLAWGIGVSLATTRFAPDLMLRASQLVSLPQTESIAQVLRQFTWPDFTEITNPQIYSIALTIAIVASLESLLSLEAIDKLDPFKRVAPADRELRAQGIGNMISGLLGGLPVSSAIVRSSVNVNAGAHTKVASFVHGILLLISVALLVPLINQIPLACLATILIHAGYKLFNPKMFVQMYRNGVQQFAPFAITFFAILLSNLPTGIAIGVLGSILFIVRSNYVRSISLTRHELGTRTNYLLRFHKDVSFINKVQLRRALESIKGGSSLIIDGSRAQFIDPDIQESLLDFVKAAPDANITVELRHVRGLQPARHK
jgi:MFS superfamily sulfate permease-like transporter